MNAAAVGMSAGGFVVVMATVVLYLRTIPLNKVPKSVSSLVAGLIVGVTLAAGSIAWSVQSTGSVGAAVVAPAAFSLMLGGFFLYIVTLRKVPAGDLQVSLGGKLLPFEAKTSEGAPFESSELDGKRTLLKFFRGGW